MKCNRKVFYYQKTSKSGKRRIFGWANPDQNLNETVEYWTKNVGNNFDRNYETCDGEVVGEIRAVDEPYFGGLSAELSVEFKCKKCKCGNYPELPNKYTINDWLNRILQEME